MTTEDQEPLPNEKSVVSIAATSAIAMTRMFQTVKGFKKTWDSDKALESTSKGLFGKYQLRACALLALGYGLIVAWLTEMPDFALLSPRFIDCTWHSSIDLNVSNLTVMNMGRNMEKMSVMMELRKTESKYNYSDDYGRSVLTDFDYLCDKGRVKIPNIIFLIGFILGGLIFGYFADHSGRKLILLGSIWTACVLSIFQLLSEDYISYAFFMLFLGITIGSVQVITIPYVMEMFPSRTRAIYGLSLLGVVIILNLFFPWLALLVKNWKILQAIVTVPLILTAVLNWYSEESMFWFTAQKDYRTAISSLTKIARFNGLDFEARFHEARTFLHARSSKGIQCDFQPLLRLEDIKLLGLKYPDFDLVDLEAITNKKISLTQRIVKILTGHHYTSTMSTFYPTDFLHSPILSTYLFIMCGLWLVSSLTEYSLDAPYLTAYLTDHFMYNYFYSHLIEVGSFIIAATFICLWGRRWPTFCFFLIAEVCLLASVAIRMDQEHPRAGVLLVYIIGKFASRAAFLTIFIYTCELFPTGLRCTCVGICFTFRMIGILLASPNAGELNDWLPRLIYGILALILGSLALLLPETKKYPLPRTILQVELIPTSISHTFRRHQVRADGVRPEISTQYNDLPSMVSGMPTRWHGPYEVQSTLHSFYELQDLTVDDTIHSASNRHSLNPPDSRHVLSMPMNHDLNRPNSTVESIKKINDPTASLPIRDPLAAAIIQADMVTVPSMVSSRKQSSAVDASSPKQNRAPLSANNSKTDSIESNVIEIKENDNSNEILSESPRYRRTMSQDENYFSEHC